MNRFVKKLARALVFGLLSIGVYVLTLFVPTPPFDILGLSRVAAVAILGRLLEDGIYALAAQSILEREVTA